MLTDVRERRPIRGREQRALEIEEWLGPGGPRLITLTGLPGVGKTRLVRHVLDLPDGPGLPRRAMLLGSPPSDEALTPSSVVRAATVGEDAEAAPSHNLLLVIDNLVPRPSTSDAISRLLTELDGVRLLVTARSPLHLPDEQVVRLSPLPSPSPTAPSSELAEHPAVQLFCDVARAAGATIDADSLADVAAICATLGGHPLAIELAASRTNTLSPASLHHLLRRRSPIDVLAADPAEGPNRDLFGALAWSEGLLSPTQRALLHHLAVFHRPVPLSAVEAVAPDDGVLEELTALVEVQLVQADHHGQITRFSLHPLIREHARRALGADADAASERHRSWATAIAEHQIARRAQRAGDVVPGDVEADLVAALHRSLQVEDGRSAAALVLALLPIWSRQAMSERRVALLVTTVEVARRTGVDVGVLARLHANLALIHAERLVSRRDAPAVEAALSEAVDLARHGDPRDLLAVLRLAVQAARLLGNWGDTAARCDEGVQLARELGDARSVTRFQVWAGMVAHQQGRPQDAADLAVAALHRARQLDDERLIAIAGGLLRSLPSRVRPDPAPDGRGLLDSARRTDHFTLRWLLPVTAGEALAAGDVAGAAAACTELAELARDAASWDWCELAVAGLVRVADVRNDDGTAARLHGLIAHRMPVLGNTLPPEALAAYERAVDRVRDRLGDAAFDAAGAASAGATRAEMFALVIGYGRDASTPGTPPTPSDEAPPLTARECDVLERLVAGDTNHELAQRLGITAKTAMHHTSSIYRKLGVRGRPDAVAWAVRHGG